MKSEKDKQRYREWRKNNPDKVREQRKRRYARSIGVLPPFEKPEPLTEEQARARHVERMRRHHQRRKERIANDPEYAQRQKEQEQARYRARYARLKADPNAYALRLEIERNRRRGLTSEKREARNAEKQRLKEERAAERAAARLAVREAKQREKEAESKRKELERIKQRNIQRALIESQKAVRAEQQRVAKPKPAFKPKRGRILALCGWNGY